MPPNSLEEFEEKLKGEEKVRFLQFMRKMLRWVPEVPEERISAFDLLDDPWLNSRSLKESRTNGRSDPIRSLAGKGTMHSYIRLDYQTQLYAKPTSARKPCPARLGQ